MKNKAPKSSPQSAPHPASRRSSSSSLYLVAGRRAPTGHDTTARSTTLTRPSDSASRRRRSASSAPSGWSNFQTVKVAIGCPSWSLVPGHLSRLVVRTCCHASRRRLRHGGLDSEHVAQLRFLFVVEVRLD